MVTTMRPDETVWVISVRRASAEECSDLNTWLVISLKGIMTNSYGISDRDEQKIRARDKRCVYCDVKFKKTLWRDSATIEHFNNDGPFAIYSNIAMCCRACNSSKGVKKLLTWLDSPYCQKKNIRQKMAKVVRQHLRTKARPHKDITNRSTPTATRRVNSLLILER